MGTIWGRFRIGTICGRFGMGTKFVGNLEWADTTFGGSLEWAGTTFGFLLDRELVAKLLFNYVHVIIDNVTHQLHIPPL